MKNEELKLEDRNIENTHPAELKRIQRKEIQVSIESYKKKIEFALVNVTFFLFIIVMMFLNQSFNNYFIIIPGVIAMAFSVRAELYHENLKSERTSQRMLELFYKENNL